MATYASASNPFIEANGDGGQQLQSMKNAPGMARPHKLSLNLKSSGPNGNCCARGTNLSPIDESNGKKVGQQATSGDDLLDVSDDSKQELHSFGDASESKLSTANSAIQCSATTSSADDDEISKTCQSLVEVAVKLSLQDGVLENGSSRISHATANRCGNRNSANCVATRHASDQDQDGDDDDFERDDQISSHDKHPELEEGKRNQHIELIKKLRLQLSDLERYAYERGELGNKVPASVLAERQNLVIETLKNKLCLNLDRDKIEKLELGELKEQVDKEIDDLIDPLKKREHLLRQLKSQLTDLERYVTHLHTTLGISSEGKLNSPSDTQCICPQHGPCSPTSSERSLVSSENKTYSITDNDSLPSTARLIKGLIAHLICSDMKIRETIRKADSKSESDSPTPELADTNEATRANGVLKAIWSTDSSLPQRNEQKQKHLAPVTKAPQFQDGATWTLHLDKVILATDSLINLYSLDQDNIGKQASLTNIDKKRATQITIDESLVESVVRRQLVPAVRDLLNYGLIDPTSIPRSNSYASFLFDPYYLLSSLTCLPGLTSATSSTATTLTTQHNNNSARSQFEDGKIHLWDIFEDYYQSRSELNNFKQSSVKTLSQSFQLRPSMNGPIKITSKQALLIAIDDVIERMIRSKPNGPESHLKALVYIALNQGKLATWLRIVFKNKSVIRKYYHNFSFVSQPEKMDRFLAVLDELSKIEFKLSTDTVESESDQFVSAF